LARKSPVFRRMLTSTSFTEGVTASIKIEDFKAGPVRALLHYFSRGLITEESKRDHGRELFILADKYELLALKAHMAAHLAASLSVDNVLEIAKLADMHSSAELKEVSSLGGRGMG
jgi:BTB/POZ domain